MVAAAFATCRGADTETGLQTAQVCFRGSLKPCVGITAHLTAGAIPTGLGKGKPRFALPVASSPDQGHFARFGITTRRCRPPAIAAEEGEEGQRSGRRASSRREMTLRMA